MAKPGVRLDVLVVDDSAVVRETLAAVLARDPALRVTVAPDPLIAMEKMKRQRPDVIVLDLEMPRMDGLSFLRKLMREDPIPVVVCSGQTGAGTEAALRALAEGAVAIVTKTKLGVRDFLQESSTMLIATIRDAAAAPVRPAKRPRALAPPPPAPRIERAPSGAPSQRLVAVGASAGGTVAIQELLEALPPSAPGVVIVQHMPEPFTAAFARRLDASCRVRVKEAVAGDPVLEGQALLARGNHHLVLRRDGNGYAVDVVDGPLVSGHRPSVDVLFRSVARTAGAAAMGVILTGMGSDGADGLGAIQAAGGLTVAQNEATCLVFGMPKEAIARGAARRILPLDQIAVALIEYGRVGNKE